MARPGGLTTLPAVVALRDRLVGIDTVGAPVVVGCSGGPDSLALLVLAQSCALDPVAVHVDHGVRPGSDQEAVTVAEHARRLGVRSHAVANAGEQPRLWRARSDARDGRDSEEREVPHTIDAEQDEVFGTIGIDIRKCDPILRNPRRRLIGATMPAAG